MPADVRIVFRAEGKQAQQELQKLQKEIAELRQQLGQTQHSADAAEKGIEQLGGQSRQTTVALGALEERSNAVRRETLEYRTAISRLNAELAQNRQALLTADAAAKKTLETRNRQIRAETGLLRARQQSSALTLSTLQQERRELGGVSRTFGVATRRSGVFQNALSALGGTVGAIGIDSLVSGVTRFISQSARASIQIDSNTRALGVLTGSAFEAAKAIKEVQALSDEPGLQFRQAVAGTVALRAIGVEAETTTRILRELANAAAFSGGEGEFERGLLGFRQIIQRGRVSQEELNQITENIGLASKAIKEEFGTVLAEDIQEELDRTGQSIDDFVERTLTAFEKLERFPLDAPAVKLKNLGNSFYEFQAAVGNLFLPAIASGAEGLTLFFDGFKELISVTDAAREAAKGLAEIIGADDALGRDTAIQNRIMALRELVKEQERAARTAGFWQHQPTFEARAEGSRVELQEIERIAAGDPEKIRELREEMATLNEELQRINTAQTDLNESSGIFRFFSAFSPENLDSLEEADIAINKVIDSTEKSLESAEEAAEGVADAEREKIKATADATAATEAAEAAAKAAEAAIRAQTDALLALITAKRQTREHVQGLSQAQGVLNDFWRVASGEVQGYTGSIDVATVAISSHATELAALDAIFEGFADPLQENIDRYGTLTRAIEKLSEESRAYAADQAIATAEIKLVNPAISAAVGSLRDYNDALLETGVNFADIDDISERLTDSIRNQVSAFDELRRSVDGVSQAQSGLQGQQLGSGVFDQFDARTPGSDFGTSFADNLVPLQAQIGQELASQAIQTAGELRRIEEDRVESLEDLERQYSEKIIAINEEKRQKLAEVEQKIEAERVRRLQSIQGAFDTAKDAEIDARQETADRILDIERDAAEQRNRLGVQLNENIFALEQERDARIRELNEGRVERARERQQEILAITERATQARAEAEQQYAEQVQEIHNRLVESIRDIQSGLQAEIESLESGFVARQADRADEIVRITQEAADARVTANQTFTETMEGIYTDLVNAWDTLEEGFTDRQEDRAQERITIEQRAADARVAANEGYADRLARISTDLVDEVRRIESEIIDVQQRHADDRFAIEQESIESRAEANADYARRLEEIESDRGRQLEEQARRLAAIQQEATDARLEADREYATEFQDIQNDLVDEVTDIQEGLNDTLNALRDDALDTERERQQSLVDLHEETQQKLEDLERNRARTVEDLNRKFEEDRADARQRNVQKIAEINSDSSLSEVERAERREKADRELTRRLLDLGRAHNRRVNELGIQQSRQREDLARQAAAKEIEIAERAAAQLSGIAQQETDVRTQAQSGISEAESAAGVAFREAQQHYVPALSAHEQALLEHTAALNQINQESATATEAVNPARSEAIQAGFDEVSAAATALSEALTAVTSAEQERLGALGTETSAAVGDLQEQRSAAETLTGLTFDEALANYTPAVDLNTQALQALTSALDAADIERHSALGTLDATGSLDRLTTQTAQRELAVGAGVSIEEARANFVPALSNAAQATLTLNATMQALDTSFREAISEIQNAGLVDRQSVDLAIQTAISEAAAEQTALETQAGTTFGEASAAFTPGLSDISQAGVDRDTTLGDISQSETEEIDALNAQSIADRLETDAAITETRDVFLKASAQETLKYQTEVRQINNAMRLDIREVDKTLQVNLESIDDTLDTELAEIRELKSVFDTKISAMITAINEQGNLDVANLKADTAAMRSSLEAIAEEARDNQWKSALAKIASTGITIAGVAIGTAVGAPQVGLVAGQLAGGLVEQGVNELFHFEQTDRIAHRMARSAAFRQPRPAPNYLPTPAQLKNAADVGREIVAGFTEGLSQRERGSFGSEGTSQQSGFPEEITATLQIQFPDGTVQELRDQIIRLEAQDR